MKKILHIITDLDTGGTETMLYKLLMHTDREQFEPTVISLSRDGPVGEKIRALGIPVWCLGMKPSLGGMVSLPKLARQVKKIRPDVVQTWMYHSDLVGGLAARLAGNIPVIWNIRNSTLNPRYSRRSTIWTVKLCALFSRTLPKAIISCSENARQVHTALGYMDQKMVVVPNGFELDVFQPDENARQSVRQELRLPADAVLIGLMARFNPQKEHKIFIEAARICSKDFPEVHFLLCGDRIEWDNPELVVWIEASGQKERFHLLGRRDDMPRLTASLDIATSSSSFGEAFPNVIGEAMASGIPCVVTDVGDSAAIVGDTGVIVPSRNSEALADGWRSLLAKTHEERIQMGLRARERVILNYDLTRIVKIYENLYHRTAR